MSDSNLYSLDDGHQQRTQAAQPTAATGNIPTTSSPVEINTLIENLHLSCTVGEGDTIEGTLTIGKGKGLVIRGTIIGDIKCEGMVVVMKGGIVEGNITASQLWIEGTVKQGANNGKLDVGTVHIGVDALVEADCTYDQISIATPNRGLKGQLSYRQAA